MRSLFLLVSTILVGCGSDIEGNCLSYYDAYEACVDSYLDGGGAESDVERLGADYCDAYVGDKDEVQAESFDCLADAYSAADCTSMEGLVAAEDSVNACG